MADENAVRARGERRQVRDSVGMRRTAIYAHVDGGGDEVPSASETAAPVFDDSVAVEEGHALDVGGVVAIPELGQRSVAPGTVHGRPPDGMSMLGFDYLVPGPRLHTDPRASEVLDAVPGLTVNGVEGSEPGEHVACGVIVRVRPRHPRLTPTPERHEAGGRRRSLP